MENDITQLISEISQKSGKSNEEIEELINEKTNKFSGLLTKEGAAFMVGKEFGLNQEVNKEVKISEISDGMKGIEVKGIVKTIFPTKEFEKNGKSGKLQSFVLEDDSGTIRVTIWNDQIDNYNLTIGSKISINNAIVNMYNEKKQLSLGFNGEINIIEKAETNFENLSNLKPNLNNINTYGRLVRKFPCKEFNSGERKGKLCNFQFGDETILLKATAWNDKADELSSISDGEIIDIKNAYTKEGLFGIELHLGYSTIIEKSNRNVASTYTILKENINKKEIGELNTNENVMINGKVDKIEDGRLFFLACEKCGKKVNVSENGIICEKCGEVKGEKKAVLSATIIDDSGQIKANFFSENALNLINLKKEDFEKMINEKEANQIIQELNEKNNGKEIKLFGYAKENSFSNDLEFSVKEIINE
ncbi:MAG: OB-fold nucleic acid binding domain-containing protein [Candidatus ainarchaeum sp.]|nr:OB-fold nucleic acid binding domain-containing protein [Candidatus ainarchaeum sp.]